jgi:uncharacterized protein
MSLIPNSSDLFPDADEETSAEFQDTVRDIVSLPQYQKLKKFVHHNSTSRYQHCLNTAWCMFVVCKNRGLAYKSAARGAMLHDFYLYNTRDFRRTGMDHDAVHPRCALRNAEKYFEIDEIMRDCILHHMWPAAAGKPETAEGKLMTLVDKYCASVEWGVGTARKLRPLLLDLLEKAGG